MSTHAFRSALNTTLILALAGPLAAFVTADMSAETVSVDLVFVPPTTLPLLGLGGRCW